LKDSAGDCTEIKFVVDGMLGTLAKWLRLLGYDTIYLKNTPDDVLLRRAVAEKRILLTRDTRLLARREVKRKVVNSLLIEVGHLEDQLLQVVSRFDLKSKRPFCTICNRPLENVAKEAVKEKVPLYVFQTQQSFSVCPSCHRYYWSGTHWERIAERIKT
jgi:uncharacterized protein with PIN domain